MTRDDEGNLSQLFLSQLPANVPLSPLFTSPGLFHYDAACCVPEEDPGQWHRGIVTSAEEIKSFGCHGVEPGEPVEDIVPLPFPPLKRDNVSNYVKNEFVPNQFWGQESAGEGSGKNVPPGPPQAADGVTLDQLGTKWRFHVPGYGDINSTWFSLLSITKNEKKRDFAVPTKPGGQAEHRDVMVLQPSLNTKRGNQIGTLYKVTIFNLDSTVWLPDVFLISRKIYQ